MVAVAPPSDEQLMERLQRGDRAAFAELHRRWEGPIWSFLLRRLGQREAAEECFQEVWVRLWRGRDRYDPTRPFRPWIYTIAANLGRNQRKHPSDPELFEVASGGSDRVAARDELVKVLDSLGEPDRTVILLTGRASRPPRLRR